MKLSSPLIITPRLMPGVRIGKAFVSLDPAPVRTEEGRVRYSYHIDNEGREFSGHDLQSGVGAGLDIQGMLETLLAFLEAAAESYSYEMRNGKGSSDNSELFPEWVCEWAYIHSDEISMLRFDLEENENLVS